MKRERACERDAGSDGLPKMKGHERHQKRCWGGREFAGVVACCVQNPPASRDIVALVRNLFKLTDNIATCPPRNSPNDTGHGNKNDNDKDKHGLVV